MRVLTKEEADMGWGEFGQKILDGEVFIYPTDTIYGIGCNAENEKAVAKIRELKDRSKAPFSVIAPSVDWIKENCQVSKEAEEWLKKLPGPYTLILPLKKTSGVAKSVVPEQKSLGVRIPKHWIVSLLGELRVPIVTTSANKTGRRFMRSIDDLDPDIKRSVAFTIYEGEKDGRPSTLVHLDEKETKVKER